MSYDILAIVCLYLRCVSECMYVSMCIYVYLCIYVCMYDVRHDIQIPCTRYVAINRLYLYLEHKSFDKNTTLYRDLEVMQCS